jgi:hypothetical protein
MKFQTSLLLACLALLAGCADIIEGRSQELTIQSDPAGAACSLSRNGAPLGSIAHTPDTLYVEKTKDDITITCAKPGYEPASFVNPSGYPENNWIYILVGGPIGWGIDSATGADNLYTSPVTIPLTKR